MAARRKQRPGTMKVWKSPVLYFGVLLVIVVIGLLAAPFIIDWNGYRADLEAYGKKLTGREVIVEGPVSARLFPWPRLTVENVKKTMGLDITIVTSAETDEEGRELLKLIGMPFRRIEAQPAAKTNAA